MRDSTGLSATQSVVIWPTKVNLSFDTVPTGRTLYLDGIAKTAPFVYDTLVGLQPHDRGAKPDRREHVLHVRVMVGRRWAAAHHHRAVDVAELHRDLQRHPASVGVGGGVRVQRGVRQHGGGRVGDRERGTRSSGATRTTGKYGGALSFNGASDWVTVPDANSLDLNRFTISAWVKPAATQSGWRTAVMKEIPSSGLAYALYANGVLAVGARRSTSTTAPRSAPARAIEPARRSWSYVTGSYDGSTLRLYVDGVLKASKASTGTTGPRAGRCGSAATAVWGEWFNGALDEIRIYNRALSATEIATDRTTPIEQAPATLNRRRRPRT